MSTPPASPPAKSWREIWLLPILVAALPAMIGAYYAGRTTAPGPTPSPTELDADAALHLDSFRLQGSNEVSGGVVRVSGSLKQPLPSGATIWVATRTQEESQGDPAIRAAGVGLADGPCDVEPADATFNCGEVTLGGAGETGGYFLYVIIAAPSAARDFVQILFEQKETDDYRHQAPPPGSTSVLGPVSITRTS